MSSTALPEKNNMTTGPEWRRLLLFALPIMAGQFLQQLYNTVDGIVVGRYVSAAALGAVGSCTMYQDFEKKERDAACNLFKMEVK